MPPASTKHFQTFPWTPPLLLDVMGLAVMGIVLLGPMGRCLHAQDSPQESLATLHPAEGLEVSLWASEPLVMNPTSMDIDSRGRVWIAEGLNYRMKQRDFKTLKRIEGADRIKVLTDTDGDGKADKVVVFAEDLFPVPLGLAVEEIWENGQQTGTRVYVGNSPDLLVLEDTDGDDRADRRYPLLSGFGGIDSDHGLHGMTFGPDGKLYFTVGDARYGADHIQAGEATFDITDKSGRHVVAKNFGTTLRVNRDGTQFEVLSSGHRNNYEAVVDSFGNVFGSDNDDDGNRGCRMYWVMDGGAYGYQHPKSSRHWAEELPGIIPKLVGTGNGAPAGVTLYEGDLLPSKFWGAVLQIDSGTRQVNSHPLHRHGAGFRSDYDLLLKGDDAWFRPVDLTVAPDGSVFICDWYDATVGANLFSDQTTGRIYRLAPPSKTQGETRQPPRFNGQNAIEAIQSPNPSTRLAARSLLISQGASARTPLLKLFQSGRPHEQARALHVLFALPETGVQDAVAALGDPDPRLRETALQLLTQDVSCESLVESTTTSTMDSPAVAWLDEILPLADDPDAGVRRTLLMALRNVPTAPIRESLVKMTSDWDGSDRYYLEAIRSALIHRESSFLQELFDDLARHAIESGWEDAPAALPPYFPIGSNDAFLHPQDQLLGSNPASRLMGLAWSLQRPESLPAISQILQHNQSLSVEHAATIALSIISDPTAGHLMTKQFFSDSVDEKRKRDILTKLGERVSGPWNALTPDAMFKKVFTAALENHALQEAAIAAIAQGKMNEFDKALMKLAADQSNDEAVRATAITSLGKLKHAPVQKLATNLISNANNDSVSGPLAIASLEAMNALLGEEAQDLLCDVLFESEGPIDVQRRSLQLVAATPSGVDQVLSRRKSGNFPEDLENELSFLLHNHADDNVRQRAQKELPLKSANGKIHEVREVLALQGDAARGRELFHTHKDASCARCHRVNGEGTLVGPDLASIGMKYGDKELIYHIQYPSGAVNYGFAAHTFLLDDGRVINGLVVERKNGEITVGLATGQLILIDSDEIEEEQRQTISLMPEGLVANFSPQQLSDLVEYLLTLRQGDAIRTRPSPVK